MPYSDTGYEPTGFDTILASIITNYNDQFGTDYTAETFVGTNAYKFCYAIIQRLMDAENDTAEIYAKLQDYFLTTNERIAIPKTPIDGLIGVFNDAGYEVAIDIVDSGSAGELSVCVNVDDGAEDYAERKEEILNILATYTAAGLFFNGEETGDVTFSNGQTFEFAYFLPELTPIILRVDITVSANTTLAVDSEEVIKEKILENVQTLYKLGNDFEPLKYFDINRDAPYASEVLLEWSDDDGSNWHSTVSENLFTDLFVLENGVDDIAVTLG